MDSKVSNINQGKAKQSYPLYLLKKISNLKTNCCLQVTSHEISYYLYFNQGQLVYGTNSVDPFERLERHLYRLSYSITTLKKEVRTQVRLKFEPDSQNTSNNNCDYKAICWLIKQKYLTTQEASQLVIRLTQEVIETYILLSKIEKKVLIRNIKIPIIYSINIQNIVQKCQKRLKEWQSFEPNIYSSYQRPYFLNNSEKKNLLSVQQQKKLSNILRGFNFRQIAVLLNQDELIFAKKIYPLIVEGIVVLKEPQKPFNTLPSFFNNSGQAKIKSTANFQKVNNNNIDISDISNNALTNQNYKIICVDDSPTILEEIKRFLDNDKLSLFSFDDSVKALRQIIRIKPDLILLDVGMPNLDGYRLCSLIRNNSCFKNTPIIMVTANKDLINRAKAKMSGATDYMTKPFNQSDLTKMVFRYLI